MPAAFMSQPRPAAIVGMAATHFGMQRVAHGTVGFQPLLAHPAFLKWKGEAIAEAGEQFEKLL